MAPIELIKDTIPDIRFLHDLQDVVYDQEWFKTAPNFESYYMYRGLFRDENDKEKIFQNNLRYDITIITPQMLGKEFPKTLGHEHAKANGTDLSYPEIYEMLKGEGDFLIQRREGDKITEIRAIKIRQGEKIIIPPNYAHFMLNVQDTEIIMANWFEKNAKSDYSPIKEKRGAGYFAIKSENNSINWIKNENYSAVPELKIYEAKDFNYLLEQFSISPNEPMYNLVNSIEKLDFLKNPQKYAWK